MNAAATVSRTTKPQSNSLGRLLWLVGFVWLICFGGSARADGGESYSAVANMLGAAERMKMPRTLRQRRASGEIFAWGVAEQSADDFTRMTGWRLTDSLHLGYQQGLDSGLSLLWQGERDQMSFSTEGIRFTRRF